MERLRRALARHHFRYPFTSRTRVHCCWRLVGGFLRGTSSAATLRSMRHGRQAPGSKILASLPKFCPSCKRANDGYATELTEGDHGLYQPSALEGTGRRRSRSS
jgi:hypothetical protein